MKPPRRHVPDPREFLSYEGFRLAMAEYQARQAAAARRWLRFRIGLCAGGIAVSLAWLVRCFYLPL